MAVKLQTPIEIAVRVNGFPDPEIEHTWGLFDVSVTEPVPEPPSTVMIEVRLGVSSALDIENVRDA